MNRDFRGWSSFSKLDFKADYQLVTHNYLKGTIRGLHYSLDQSKIVHCVQGSIFDVIVDMNVNSPFYLKWLSREISSSELDYISVPAGYAHGYQTLEDNTKLLYFFDLDCPDQLGVLWNDPKVSIKWPLNVSAISEKDLLWPLL